MMYDSVCLYYHTEYVQSTIILTKSSKRIDRV